jgi:hypothetical protein
VIELVRRDDESNPGKGQTAARELIDKEGCELLFGGIDSPVSQAIVPLMNTAHVPFMGVWAAATNITRNGATPNYVFRVSVVDVLVDHALIKHAMTSFGSKTPGLRAVRHRRHGAARLRLLRAGADRVSCLRPQPAGIAAMCSAAAAWLPRAQLRNCVTRCSTTPISAHIRPW